MQTILPKLLIVEDQASMRNLLEDFLQPNGFEVESCDSADVALKRLGLVESSESFAVPPSNGNFDLVLTDVKMPGLDGLEFCRRVKHRCPDLPVIVMTAYGSMETAVEALRAGAFDFVTKPVELELLKASLDRAAENSQLRRQIQQLEIQASKNEFGALVGESDVMIRLKQQLSRVVESTAAVLLTGESGSGKEVVARELHQQSERASNPFIAINCAAIPEALLESELFGHKKGAFTDAHEDRQGLLIKADGGTLFLDEIGDMPISIQPKLLRALEQKTVRPVGSEHELPFDVRLIAATNRDLVQEIEEKRFREDLYYRINVLEISVPPLRSRGTDVLLLANHYLKLFAAANSRGEMLLDDQVMEKLLAYRWPGNVRELRNAIERAVVLTQGSRVEIQSLPTSISEHQPDKLVIDETGNQPLASLETVQRRYIEFVIEKTGGNKTEAARILGLDRKTLYRKLKE